MTRGEWLIHFDAGDRGRGISIAITSGTGNDLHNARLIAAAPEMLEAISDMVSSIRAIDAGNPILNLKGLLSPEIEFCETVIKKARGEE